VLCWSCRAITTSVYCLLLTVATPPYVDCPLVRRPPRVSCGCGHTRLTACGGGLDCVVSRSVAKGIGECICVRYPRYCGIGCNAGCECARLGAVAPVLSYVCAVLYVGLRLLVTATGIGQTIRIVLYSTTSGTYNFEVSVLHSCPTVPNVDYIPS